MRVRATGRVPCVARLHLKREFHALYATQYDVGRRWFAAFFSSGVKVKMTVARLVHYSRGKGFLLERMFGVSYRLIDPTFRSRCIYRRMKKIVHQKSFTIFLCTYARVSIAETNNKRRQ